MKTRDRRTRNAVPGGILAACAMALLLVIPACDQSTTEVDDPHGEAAGVLITDRLTGELLASTELVAGAPQWADGGVQLEVNEEVTMDVTFVTEEGQVIAYAAGVQAMARLETGAPEGVIEFESHVDHIDVEAVAPGSTQLVFMFWEDGEVTWESPPLPIDVTD